MPILSAVSPTDTATSTADATATAHAAATATKAGRRATSTAAIAIAWGRRARTTVATYAGRIRITGFVARRIRSIIGSAVIVSIPAVRRGVVALSVVRTTVITAIAPHATNAASAAHAIIICAYATIVAAATVAASCLRHSVRTEYAG